MNRKLVFESLDRRDLLAVDLRVSLDGHPAEAIPGQPIDLHVEVRNLGSHDAFSVNIGVATGLVRQSTEVLAFFPSSVDRDSLDLDPELGLIFSASPHSQTAPLVGTADVNGDSIDDVYFADRVLFGKVALKRDDVLNLDGSNGFVVAGNTDGLTPTAIVAAADFNGDGVGDLVIGNSVRHDIVLGRPNIGDEGVLSPSDSSSLRILSAAGSIANPQNAGDVNGDGINDLVVSLGTRESRLAFIWGTAVLADETQEIHIGELSSKDGVEFSSQGPPRYSAVGDITGDGFADLLVFESFTEVYLLEGSASFGNVKELDVLLDAQATRLFHSVPSPEGHVLWGGGNVGDVNGDGFNDLVIVDESIVDGCGDVLGASYLVFGGAALADRSELDLSLLDGSDGIRLCGAGEVAAGAGDVNGDGLDDFVVGHPTPKPGSIHGISHVVFGATNLASLHGGFLSQMLDGTNGFSFERRIPVYAGSLTDRIGASLDISGDINADGLDDVLIGAPFAGPASGRPDGEVYLIYGRGPTDVGANAIMDVPAGTSRAIRVRGRVGDGTGELLIQVTATPMDGQIDENAANNVASVAIPVARNIPPGDIDFDGDVDFDDFVLLALNFGRNDVGRDAGDFDFDGDVDFEDFVVLANNFGRQIDA